MSKPKASPLIFFFGLLAIIIIISLLGPEEADLGANVRIVYLHGAWVLTAEVAFFAAALTGLIGLLAHFISALKPREGRFHRWSAALGRAGMADRARTLLTEQLTTPVRWVSCMEAAARLAPGARFIEVGPGNVLAGLCKRIVPGAAVVSLGTADEVARFLEAA